jgi:hypothetical protein
MKESYCSNKSIVLSHCPLHIAANLKCMDSTKWPSSDGWGTTLSLFKQRANIGYNGINSTILYHKFLSDPEDARISASDLLYVFNTVFNKHLDKDSGLGLMLSAMGRGTNKPMALFAIWFYFLEAVELGTEDSRVNRYTITGLQSLLAIVIHYCQARHFANLGGVLTRPLSKRSTLIGQTLLQQAFLFPEGEANVDIVPAFVRWSLKVGHTTIIAYIILAGVCLAACTIAQIMGSFTKIGKRVRHMGTFPVLDQLCNTELRDPTGRHTIPSIEYFGLASNEQLAVTANWRVVIAKRGNSAPLAGKDNQTLAEKPSPKQIGRVELLGQQAATKKRFRPS